jgi:hypothetical protein
MAKLARVMPNEKGQLVLRFTEGDVRIFDASIAWTEFDWPELGYPMKLKNLTYTPDGVRWPGERALDAGYQAAGQCSALQGGGEGPRGRAARPERALNRAFRICRRSTLG